MIKKLLLLGGAVAVGGLIFFGTDAISYVTTSAGQLRQSVKDSVPIEFEIERAREMAANLERPIRRNMRVIAQEEVEVEKLENQIVMTDEQLEKQRGEILQLRTALAEDKSSYRFTSTGREYGQEEVKQDLANRFERFKTSQATLDSLRDIHDARLRSLEAARQKLDGMIAAKRKLQVDIENLEARLKMVEVAQTTSDYNFDDSELARVKDHLDDVRTRLAVAEKLVGSEVALGEIQLENPQSAPEDIVDQVTEYFELQPSSTSASEAAY